MEQERVPGCSECLLFGIKNICLLNRDLFEMTILGILKGLFRRKHSLQTVSSTVVMNQCTLHSTAISIDRAVR